jgi:hypothetical protein
MCRRRVVKISLFITSLHFEKGHGVILPQTQNHRHYWILDPTATKHDQQAPYTIHCNLNAQKLLTCPENLGELLTVHDINLLHAVTVGS